ncbi:unnamed protein product [Spodoptera exigua]|nr:unnamed protein product [Spodoptera exigua]
MFLDEDILVFLIVNTLITNKFLCVFEFRFGLNSFESKAGLIKIVIEYFDIYGDIQENTVAVTQICALRI